MNVKITVAIDVARSGDIRLRHDCDDAVEPDERAGIFGIPAPSRLTDKDRKEILDTLTDWIVSRFKVEVDAALNNIK